MRRSMKNPFALLPGASETAGAGIFDGEGFVIEKSDSRTANLAHDVHAALRAVLHDPEFPCVGAKSVINQNSYRFGLYPELATEESTAGLAADLFDFIQQRPKDAQFTSFIASFSSPKIMTPKEFEVLLWKQLKLLHDVNRRFFKWSSDVSANPEDPGFSFSFGGRAFFIVGLSPASQRWARRFPWPTLVFNDHAQFEKLREEQRFDRIKDLIRERDESVHGSPNPMLADYGAHSEARQYAGRRVSEGWRCPVHFDS